MASALGRNIERSTGLSVGDAVLADVEVTRGADRDATASAAGGIDLPQDVDVTARAGVGSSVCHEAHVLGHQLFSSRQGDVLAVALLKVKGARCVGTRSRCASLRSGGLRRSVQPVHQAIERRRGARVDAQGSATLAGIRQQADVARHLDLALGREQADVAGFSAGKGRWRRGAQQAASLHVDAPLGGLGLDQAGGDGHRHPIDLPAAAVGQGARAR